MARAKKVPTKEQEDRKNLISYLQSVSSEPLNYPMVMSQLKKMMQENPSMTFNGIKYTLQYAIKHEGLKVNSLGIVPYLYEDAKRYYEWRTKMKKQIGNWKYEDAEATIVKRQIEEVVFE